MNEKKDDVLLENTEESVEYKSEKAGGEDMSSADEKSAGVSDTAGATEEKNPEGENPEGKNTEQKKSEEKKELTPEELEKQQEEERERQLQELENRKEKRRRKKRRKKIASIAVVICAVLGASGAGVYHLYDSMNQYKQETMELQETVESLENELKTLRGEETASEELMKPEDSAETEAQKEEATEGASAEETEEDEAEETSDTEKEAKAEETSDTEKEAKAEESSKTEKTDTSADAEAAEASETEAKTVKKYLKKAAQYAEQYDYDRAIKTLKKYENYDTNEELQAKVKEYKEIKASCVSWPISEVTHIFYHTLIKEPSKSFDGDYKEGDYNQVMTTIDEFNKITQSMYDKGYVMVSIYDMATVGEDGTMQEGEILLPEGKIPFVLSQDDVCYYHYMDGDGYASKLVLDEDGKVRNEYIEDDGSVSIGDYDVVPLIDRFVEEHPDFSYKGAKGIVALTGYNGILGYRTDISYETKPDDLDAVKVQWLEEHPDFDLEKEREEASKVAAAMKENGWLFASHTWGHLNVQEASLKRLQTDTEKFKENVDPLIGGTDIIIFAFGTDLTQVVDYSGEKFEYYKEQGYNYFCNVDSSKYFVQLRDNYLRMGRRNVDGYRMYYNPELLEDLFVVEEVFDKSRPTPVPEM